MKRKWKILIVTLFAVGGLVFMALRLGSGDQSTSRSTGLANTVGIAELDAIESFTEATSPEDAAQVARQLTDRALATPGLFDSASRRSLQNEEQLRRLIENRLRLMFDPSYDTFVRQVGELMGRDGQAALQGTMFENEKLWYAFANSYKYAGVAIDATRGTLDLDSVTLHKGIWGGAQTTFGDPGLYGTGPIVDQGTDVFSISIPLMLPPENTPDAKIRVVWGILSFAWDESRGKWFPYRTGVYDPSGTIENVPSLWM